MRLRTSSRADEAFDGLTVEEIRRIRGAADACVTPGLEGLNQQASTTGARADSPSPATPNRKRGRRT